MATNAKRTRMTNLRGVVAGANELREEAFAVLTTKDLDTLAALFEPYETELEALEKEFAPTRCAACGRG